MVGGVMVVALTLAFGTRAYNGLSLASPPLRWPAATSTAGCGW